MFQCFNIGEFIGVDVYTVSDSVWKDFRLGLPKLLKKKTLAFTIHVVVSSIISAFCKVHGYRSHDYRSHDYRSHDFTIKKEAYH